VFGWLLSDALQGGGALRLDPGVERYWVDHRTAWATAALKGVTSLGSNAVLVPVVAFVVVVLLARGRDWRRALFLTAAIAGSVALYQLFKTLADRPRPPVAVHLVHASGSAFPSGHATDAAAVWAALAVIAATGRSVRVKWAMGAAAALVALIVGFSRIYLGVHWLTDVVAGLALGWAWLAFLVVLLTRARSS
jgi:membrane-associated phospholipid phosphatase